MKVFVIGGATVKEADASYLEEKRILQIAMKSIGKQLAVSGHEILVCSPFKDSADLNIVYGAAEMSDKGEKCIIEFHYPNLHTISKELERVGKLYLVNWVICQITN